ncbi:MFS transporter [Brachybacterium saurashtrense]|uniref:MFS transporter n=1 Tax=Brachybacterium saurashtrense TaxID=556288 RepID=A0A345YPP0_9MICO|nr:MFS transporter [Brachybacterium saurashtrense]AXK45892.1 MFS transporter [Brachybacterium saurashtrense]RRR24911.1 MFS transporter [Brachybacterium saurashtrense]
MQSTPETARTADPPRPAPGAMTSAQRTTLVLASLGFFLITLDVLIVNLALPSIEQDLGGGTSAQQWILDGYTLLFAALLLCAGNLSDRLGARRAYLLGLAAFGVASLLCALAPSAALLIAARCVQGATAALMLPASMALVREAFEDPAARSRALGIWASGGAVASAAGPLLGGFLSALDWRLIFAVNVPVILGMLLLAGRIASSPRRPAPFDLLGQVLAVVGLGALVIGLIEGGESGFGSAPILGCFVLAAVALGGFVLAQARVAHPMMPLTLFRTAPMRIAMFGGFVFILTWFGTVFLTSLFLQQQLGLDSGLAGLCFLPSAVMAFVGNVASGHLANRFGTRVPTVLGLTSMTVGVLGLAVAAGGESVLAITLLIVLVGTGGSLATPPFAGVVLAQAAPGQAGIASATANMFRQVGGALAIAVCGVLIAHSGGFVSGMQTALVGMAVLGALGAGLSLRLGRAASTPA